jgi:hypothetical protein
MVAFMYEILEFIPDVGFCMYKFFNPVGRFLQFFNRAAQVKFE